MPRTRVEWHTCPLERCYPTRCIVHSQQVSLARLEEAEKRSLSILYLGEYWMNFSAAGREFLGTALSSCNLLLILYLTDIVVRSLEWNLKFESEICSMWFSAPVLRYFPLWYTFKHGNWITVIFLQFKVNNLCFCSWNFTLVHKCDLNLLELTDSFISPLAAFATNYFLYFLPLFNARQSILKFTNQRNIILRSTSAPPNSFNDAFSEPEEVSRLSRWHALRQITKFQVSS